MKRRIILFIMLLSCMKAQLVIHAQMHSQCYLNANGLLNQGQNPSASQIIAKMEQYAQEYLVPYEIIAAVAYQESGIRQFASDGYLLHNITECSALYNGQNAPNPPGLGMMQLTGQTAQAFNLSLLRTSWEYNLWAGVQVLINKFNIYKNYDSPSWMTGDIETFRGLLENWYMPAWRYNGYKANFGSYANKIFSHIKNKPGILSTYITGDYSSLLRPYDVIEHFWDPDTQPYGNGKGEPFVARSDGIWYCYHGYQYSASAVLSSTWIQIDATSPTQPGAPIASPNPNAGDFQLAWVASQDYYGNTDYVYTSGMVKYVIYRSPDPTGPWDVSQAIVIDITTNSYSFTNHPQGTWYFRIKAKDNSNNASWSDVGSVVVDNTPPSQPGQPVASPNPNSGNFTLTWTASSDDYGIVKYVIYRSADPAGPWDASQAIVIDITTNSYSFTNHPQGTWYFRIKAKDNSNNVSWSEVSSAVEVTSSQAGGGGGGGGGCGGSTCLETNFNLLLLFLILISLLIIKIRIK